MGGSGFAETASDIHGRWRGPRSDRYPVLEAKLTKDNGETVLATVCLSDRIWNINGVFYFGRPPARRFTRWVGVMLTGYGVRN